jgi:hypothetical protein
MYLSYFGLLLGQLPLVDLSKCRAGIYGIVSYLLIVLKTGTYMYLTTLSDPSSCTLSK